MRLTILPPSCQQRRAATRRSLSIVRVGIGYSKRSRSDKSSFPFATAFPYKAVSHGVEPCGGCEPVELMKFSLHPLTMDMRRIELLSSDTSSSDFDMLNASSYSYLTALVYSSAY